MIVDEDSAEAAEEEEELELQIMVVRGDFLPPERERNAAWRITMNEGKAPANIKLWPDWIRALVNVISLAT